MITRREFSKFGLGVTALSSTAHTVFSADKKKHSPSVSLPKEWNGVRRTGVRINGEYWGGDCEKIDMLSGNLNYSVPLIMAGGHGRRVRIFCSYNSQIWDQNGAETSVHGRDVGYGYGWGIQTGSIVPRTEKGADVGYLYVNESGAEYPLSPSNGVWVSLQGLYVSYDPAEERLQFPDGAFCIMGCASAGDEADAGARYPTLIQDRNGNQIIIRYMAGAGARGGDSSARILEIQDSRAVDLESGRKTYSFIYNTDPTPHLVSIVSHAGNAESYTFSYEQQELSSPFGDNAGQGPVYALVTIQQGPIASRQLAYNQFGELRQVRLLHGACFNWEYAGIDNPGGESARGVARRGIVLSEGAEEAVYEIRSSQRRGLGSRYTVLNEPRGMATRIWSFDADPKSPFFGLLRTLEERDGRPSRVLRRTSHQWKSLASGVPYIGTTTTYLDPDTPHERVSKEEFERDLFGNLVEGRTYDFDELSKPLSVVRNTYVTDPAYISRGIYNLLLTTRTSNDAESIEKARNQYDTTPVVDRENISEHDPKYGTSHTIRGNLTGTLIGGVYFRMEYDVTGTVFSSEDGVGSTVSFATIAQGDCSTIEQVTPNKNTALGYQTMFDASRRPVKVTGPSGTQTISYDSIGRPISITTPDGAARQFAYDGDSSIETVNNRYKRCVYDDFRRIRRIEEGDNNGPASIVEYDYGSAPNWPLGACKRASIPHAPGAPPEWVHYEYDALGRTVLNELVGHQGKRDFEYRGNSATITNGRGGRQTLSVDALGRLREVTTQPAQGGAGVVTSYQYSPLGDLTAAVLPRPEGKQVHTFAHDKGGRLSSSNRAESGREDRDYNADGTLASRTDAKHQRTAYSYDAHKRLVSVRRFGADGQIRPEQCTTYHYDSNPFDAAFSQNVQGRLAAVQWGDRKALPGLLTEMYSYTPSGRVATKRLRVDRDGGPVDLDLAYAYDDEGRIVTIAYPDGGPTLNYSYDGMGRPDRLTSGSKVLVKDVSYTAAGHLASFRHLIPDGLEYITETHEIDSRCHTKRISAESEHARLVDIEYEYSALDWRVAADVDRLSGERTAYDYDSMGRLTRAQGGTHDWEVGYSYDGFGNLSRRKGKNGRGRDFDAKHDPATNRLHMDQVGYDANGNIVRLPRMQLEFDIENRLVEIRHSRKGVEQYAYDVKNRRIWKKDPNGGEELYIYGVDDRLLATYQIVEGALGTIELSLSDHRVYFGSRLIRSADKAVVLDRLHSARAGVSRKGVHRSRHLPFGEAHSDADEKEVAFTTYARDETSGLDYAEQRYYSSELGRFITPDPYHASIKLDDPDTWNRYAYVGNDPVNGFDPHGTCLLTYSCGYSYCPGAIYGASYCPVSGGGYYPDPGGGVYTVYVEVVAYPDYTESNIEFVMGLYGVAIFLVGLSTGGVGIAILGFAQGVWAAGHFMGFW